MTTKHPDYAVLAARIAVSNLHKETKKTFSGMLIFRILYSRFMWSSCYVLSLTLHIFIPEVMHDLYNIVNEFTMKKSPMISDFHYNIIMKNAERLNSAIIYDRDFAYNYFGFKVCLTVVLYVY